MADALDGFEPTERHVRLAHLLAGDQDAGPRRILYQLVGQPQASDGIADALGEDVEVLAVERALHRLAEDDLVVQALPDDGEARWTITPEGARVLFTLRTIQPLHELARIFRPRMAGLPAGQTAGSPDEAAEGGLSRLQSTSQRIGGKRDIWHVLPTDDGRWRVKREGAHRASGVHDTKQEATEAAKALASKREGTVVLHKRDGSFQDEIEPA